MIGSRGLCCFLISGIAFAHFTPISIAQGTSEKTIITPHGVFTNCSEAVFFRDRVLINEYDAAFRDYSSRNLRYADAIKENENYLKLAQDKYRNATPDAARQIAFNVAKALALDVLPSIQIKSLPKSLRDQLTPEELFALTEVIKFSNANKELIVRGMSGEEIGTDDILKPHADALVSALSKLTPIGFTISKLFTYGEAVIYPIWDWKIVRDEANAEALQLANAIAKLNSKKPENVIIFVNQTKSIIDDSCNELGKHGNIQRSIASDGNADKADVQNYLRDLINLAEPKSVAEEGLKLLLDEILEADDDITISEDVLIDNIRGFILGEPRNLETSPDNTTSAEDDELESAPAVGSPPHEEIDNPIRDAIRRSHKKMEARNIRCATDVDADNCRLRSNYERTRSSTITPEAQIGAMNAAVGIQRPVEEESADEFMNQTGLEGYTEGITNNVISRVCDENGQNCRTLVNPVDPTRIGDTNE